MPDQILLDALRRSAGQIRCSLGAMIINPELLMVAERLQHEEHLRHKEANVAVLTITKSRAAIGTRWSNGKTEWQIAKLKLVNPQIYGCGKLDLLEGAP